MAILAEDSNTLHSASLRPLPPLPTYLATVDDWRGVTNPTERRKVQNRLNQRLYRKRRRNDPPHHAQAHLDDTPAVLLAVQNSNTQQSQEETESQAQSLWQIFHSAVEPPTADRGKLAMVAKRCPISPGATEEATLAFEKWIQSRSIGSAGTDNLFVLVKFNIFRALVSNCKDLGIAVHDTLSDDAGSPFPTSTDLLDPLRVPAALRPTKLQKELQHHPWIDTLPIPKMRDNLLQAADQYDEESLCTDLIGCGRNPSAESGLIIWGEPWDPAGWEVTEEFLHRWGWTIKGCHQLADATNSWRQQRGEAPLDFTGIRCEETVEH